MELNVKMIVGGLVLFILGGLSVYLIIRPDEAVSTIEAQPIQAQPVTNGTPPSTLGMDTTTSTTDAESFYEAAEARREQQIADKAEADRLAKLKAIKERSVECKFWKQQQKTSSAAAKIDQKINEYCNLPSSSAASESSAASASSITSSNTTSSVKSL